MPAIQSTDLPIDASHGQSDIRSTVLAFVTKIHSRWTNWRKQSARFDELSRLDDTILRDIGLEQDEIWLARRGVPFTPRSWR